MRDASSPVPDGWGMQVAPGKKTGYQSLGYAMLTQRVEDVMKFPDMSHEEQCVASHGKMPCGVDEVGRGSWAGPVVAAAVILNPGSVPAGIRDSKVLSARKRRALYGEIMASSCVGVGIVSVADIDRHGIGRATLQAMKEAVGQMAVLPVVALIDGKMVPDLACASYPLIRGDSLSCSIAAASIVAKVTRDLIMMDLALEYPHYHWQRNMGYGTRQHREGLRDFGISPYHRRSFAPVACLLGDS